MNERLPKRSTRRPAGPPAAGPGVRADREGKHRRAEALGAGWREADGMDDIGLFTPLGYEPGYEYPLLVWLTDPAAPGPAFSLGRVMKRVSLRNFLAVQPAWPACGGDSRPRADDRDSRFWADDRDSRFWADDRDSRFWADDRLGEVWRAIDLVRERASVHPDRVYLIGHGAGGSDAFRIACRHPRSFGGVISLGGSFPLSESLFAGLRDVRRLPMLLCCHRVDAAGDGGESAVHTDRTLRLFHAAGAMLAMRIYPGSNDLSRSILGDVNRWLMDEVCGTEKPITSHCVR